MPTGLPRLLVLASTYPRWHRDHEPAFVHQLCAGLTDRFSVTVLTPHAPGAARREYLDGVDIVRYRYAPERWETLVHDGGIAGNVRRHPVKWLLLPGFVLAQAWSAWRLVRRLRPAVVHAHWLIPQGLVLRLLSLCFRPFPAWVVTSHGADLFSLRGGVMSALKRWVIRGATRVTVVSTPMLAEMSRLGVDSAGVRVEPMGTDLVGRFHIDHAVPRARNRLLFVGRLVPKKGVEHLLRAMPAVLAAFPETRLDVLGFGPEQERLTRLSTHLGLDHAVTFEGAVANDALPDRYRMASIFVAPFVQAPGGDQEGLGLVMVEAAGCGCPVIAGDVPAVHDVVDDACVGRIVNGADPLAISAAVIAILSEPATRDEEQARAEAVARFDWARRADAYATLLAEAARSRSNASNDAATPAQSSRDP